MKVLFPEVVGREGGKEVWVRELLQTRPVVVEAMTRTWEGKGGRRRANGGEEVKQEEGEGQGMMAFFGLIFPEEATADIQRHLFDAQESFAKEACRNLVGL